MPKRSCSASFRSELREDPDLKHVGMTNKNEIEPVPALRLDFIRPSPYIFVHLISIPMNLRQAVALIVLSVLGSAAFGRQGSVPSLSLKRIFSKPSLAGSRPADPK